MYNLSKRSNRTRRIYLILRAHNRKHLQLGKQKITALLSLARLAKASSLIRRRSRYRFLLRRHLLPSPRQNTPWVSIRQSLDDQAYLATMGLDVASFEYILTSGFERWWDTHTIFRQDVDVDGNPRLQRRSLAADGALGLILHWLTSTATESELALIFALVPSVVSRYLYFGLQILVYTLQRLPESQITWPSEDEMTYSAELIQRRHPTINGAFGFIDGLSLPVETSSDPREQEVMYNGWQHSHRIGNIFVFSPDGKPYNSEDLYHNSYHCGTRRTYNCLQVECARQLARRSYCTQCVSKIST